MKGMFGDSDLAGSLAVSQPKGRVYLKADLVTRSLNIIDAGPFVGYDPQRLDKMGTGGTVETVGGRPGVLRDAPLRGAALERKSVVEGRRVEVRVEIGGRSPIQ